MVVGVVGDAVVAAAVEVMTSADAVAVDVDVVVEVDADVVRPRWAISDLLFGAVGVGGLIGEALL